MQKYYVDCTARWLIQVRNNQKLSSRQQPQSMHAASCFSWLILLLPHVPPVTVPPQVGFGPGGGRPQPFGATSAPQGPAVQIQSCHDVWRRGTGRELVWKCYLMRHRRNARMHCRSFLKKRPTMGVWVGPSVLHGAARRGTGLLSGRRLVVAAREDESRFMRPSRAREVELQGCRQRPAGIDRKHRKRRRTRTKTKAARATTKQTRKR